MSLVRCQSTVILSTNDPSTTVLSTTVLSTTVLPTTSLSTDQITSPYWVLTVCNISTSTDLKTSTFKNDMEFRLSNAYVYALNSVQNFGRRKRAATNGTNTLQLVSISRITSTQTPTNLLYYMVSLGNTYVSPSTVISNMNQLTTQQMSILLGFPVTTVATYYNSATQNPTTDQKLWIIGAVFGSLAGVALIIWLVLFIYSRCIRPWGEPLILKKSVDLESDLYSNESQTTVLKNRSHNKTLPMVSILKEENQRKIKSKHRVDHKKITKESQDSREFTNEIVIKHVYESQSSKHHKSHSSSSSSSSSADEEKKKISKEKKINNNDSKVKNMKKKKKKKSESNNKTDKYLDLEMSSNVTINTELSKYDVDELVLVTKERENILQPLHSSMTSENENTNLAKYDVDELVLVTKEREKILQPLHSSMTPENENADLAKDDVDELVIVTKEMKTIFQPVHSSMPAENEININRIEVQPKVIQNNDIKNYELLEPAPFVDNYDHINIFPTYSTEIYTISDTSLNLVDRKETDTLESQRLKMNKMKSNKNLRTFDPLPINNVKKNNYDISTDDLTSENQKQVEEVKQKDTKEH